MARRRVHELLDRLARAGARFLPGGFLAPALPGGVVHVRLRGVRGRPRADPRLPGRGVFPPTRLLCASPRAPVATPPEHRAPLDLSRRRRATLCRPLKGHWGAGPAHHGDRRFGAAALLPVRLVEEAQPFDLAETRFDGVQAWFEQLDA